MGMGLDTKTRMEMETEIGITGMQKMKQQFPVLHSARLLLRKVRPEDGAALYRALSNPRVARYLSFRMDTTRSEERLIRYFEDCSRTLSSLHFAVLIRETGRFAGLCSLQRLNEMDSSASIGYMVDPACWNRGIATEAARQLLQFGFDSLGLRVIHASCEADNTASSRVMVKCGFRRASEEYPQISGPGTGLRQLHYSLTAEQREIGDKRYALLHN
ncbi:GNAT family N-acetyltransferase [Paenibacillus pinistramenti]|uniref:GNAT family N-acetyltransferase n=1 Tax=Paenibacillus pinistramenti TaxID=1768003 RepID=UPI001108B3A1|nr:GNAT family N-acetyltransferase [Paenibacillus pinistramenti]